jgi:hypothetical protein
VVTNLTADASVGAAPSQDFHHLCRESKRTTQMMVVVVVEVIQLRFHQF